MQIHLQNKQLRAVLDSHGSELVSLQNSRGEELLWSAGPEWPRHAPVLFPVIGRLHHDVLHHGCREYPMTQHGFARDRDFAILEATAHSVRFVLHNNPETEAMFPFQFSLETSWSLEGPSLDLTFTLTNMGAEPMPASLGWHPAFRWDPAPGWQLLFDEEEPDAIRRVNTQVQLTDPVYPSPVHKKALPLTEDQFTQGALIFASVKSRTVHYASPERTLLDMAFPDFTQFTVWKQPRAKFVCLEPWAGLPTPTSYRGEVLTQPGLLLFDPGASREFKCRLTSHCDVSIKPRADPPS